MDFIDEIKVISQTIEKIQHQIQNEQATKTAFIMPFLRVLGYDVFNPMEVHPEFTADLPGIKGEKVDYAIFIDEKPVIFIECKHCKEDLDKAKHSSQLRRYFQATEAKIGILTNGIIYLFYTDTEKPNIMDDKPFFELNMLDINESSVNELKRFSKSKINQSELSDVAKNLLYTKEIKRLMTEQLTNPSPEFIKFFASQVYSGKIMNSVIEKFSDIVQKSLKEFINEKITERLQSAIDVSTTGLPSVVDSNLNVTEETEKIVADTIVTTSDELEGFYIIKSILRQDVNIERIQCKDTKSYFGVNLDGKVTKTICRIRFSDLKKSIAIIDAEGKETKKDITNLDEIYEFAPLLISRLKFLLQNQNTKEGDS
jgi:hypothetical protein